jgi:hypothetical protein
VARVSEAILSLIILTITPVFFISYLRLRKKYSNTIASIATIFLEKEILLEKIEDMELTQSKDVNEGFIKFLSQSRDAAFKYIEDVQVSIQNYVNVLDSGDEEAVRLARMELFTHLPEVSEDDGNIPG